MHTETSLVHIQGHLNAQRCQNEVIRPTLIPSIRADPGMLLAQDNAPCHIASVTRNMLAAYNIHAMPWSAKP